MARTGLRPLGATGLKVSPLGLGMAALGRPGYINIGHSGDLAGNYDVDAMAALAHDALDAAWAAGIRYFDAARSYGRGEAFLGDWLRSRRIDPGDLVVGSKWGYTYTAEWRVDAVKHEVKEHSLAVLQRQWQESREALGNHLRLYQIHSATLDSGVLTNRQVLSELARLKSEGVAIGLTSSGVDQVEVLRRALTLRVDGRPLFDCFQSTWNLLEPSAGSELAAARLEGLGVIVKEALANGRLAGRHAGTATQAPFAEKDAVLTAQAQRLGTTPDALALATALAQPWADVVLSGAATVEQVRANAAALAIRVDDEAWSALSGLVEKPAAYWRTRADLPWN